jgi:hypothetical protein
MRRVLLGAVGVALLAVAATVTGFAATLGVDSGTIDTFSDYAGATTTTTTGAAPASACGTGQPKAMAAPASDFYVAAGSTSKSLFQYRADAAWAFTLVGSTTLNPGNTDPRGVAPGASAVYVLDRRSTTEAEVFRYGLDRTHQPSSAVLNAKEPQGLAVDEANDELWILRVQNVNQAAFECFVLSQVFTAPGPLTAARSLNFDTNGAFAKAKNPKGLALDGSFLYGTGESGDLFRLARTTAATTNAAVTIGSKALGDPAPRGAELRGGSLFLAGSTQIYRYPAVASFFPAGPDQQSNPVSPPPLEHTEAQGM